MGGQPDFYGPQNFKQKTPPWEDPDAVSFTPQQVKELEDFNMRMESYSRRTSPSSSSLSESTAGGFLAGWLLF